MGSSLPTPRENEDRFEETGHPREWSEDYRPGGFHPIHLGDTFKDGQSRVIRKLGDGSFSTVWLVVDNLNSRYLALKIMMSKYSSAADVELEICRHLAEAALSNPSQSKHILMLLDHFEHIGPNGTHLCLVYQPIGGTVASIVEKLPENRHIRAFKGETFRYPTWMANRILKHVLTGVAFLHGNGIVHGDVQTGNFLFSARDVDWLEEKELAQSESHIIPPLQRHDKWAPKHLMLGQQLYNHAELGPDMSIKISDFGAAFRSTSPPAKAVTPVALRAPELIFNEPFGLPIDIWSFGCLIYELLTVLQLFEVWMMGLETQEEADDDHLLSLNDILEPLPDSWLEKWPRPHLHIGPSRERLPPPEEEDSEMDEVYGSGDEENDGQGGSDDDGLAVAGKGDRIGNSRASPEADNTVPYMDVDGPPPFVSESLEVLFDKNKPEDMFADEAGVVTSLMRQILRYDPSERPTAAQLLEHQWFREIGG
ncbi:CMGC protein kinase [Helicocarpus griseus UAMH5409]|uniref:non-specific serine/threonine protein kinase n=1 Tax=Helicocarpus griseus UAMH5409 TaxID=1447875 RepID=A0A2B7WLG8_9EURO|nr:CMGC protein kinase [Helicocarpus griseus UAMH5409]